MRVHLAAFVLLLAVLVYFRPEPLWWALDHAGERRRDIGRAGQHRHRASRGSLAPGDSSQHSNREDCAAAAVLVAVAGACVGVALLIACHCEIPLILMKEAAGIPAATRRLTIPRASAGETRTLISSHPLVPALVLRAPAAVAPQRTRADIRLPMMFIISVDPCHNNFRLEDGHSYRRSWIPGVGDLDGRTNAAQTRVRRGGGSATAGEQRGRE
mgnify:CR=1 FL=1